MHGICGFTDFTQKEICNVNHIPGKRHSGEYALFIQNDGENPVHRTVEGYDFSIVCSGELCGKEKLISELKTYGYSLITETDAEIILYMYIHHGEKCAEKLNGNFAFAINDCMRRRIFLCCRGQDLTYMHSDTAILFSSNERRLFEMAKKPPQIDPSGISRIFSGGCDRGVLKDTFIVPEEHYMIISRRGIALKQYADMPEYNIITAKKIFPVFSELLKPAVLKTMPSANPDYNAFMRGRNARITDIAELLYDFENESYTDVLRHGFLRVLSEENSPLTALCDADSLLDYVNSSDFSPLAAEFLIRINKLLSGVHIV